MKNISTDYLILVSRLEKEENEKREPLRDSTEYQTIFKVVNTVLPTILPDNTSLEVYTEEFLARNKGSMSHLLAGSNALLQINPDNKQEVTNLLMNSIKDEFLSTRTLKVIIQVICMYFSFSIRLFTIYLIL